MAVAANESRIFTLHLGKGADALVPAGAEVALNGHTYPVGSDGLAQLPVGRAAADASVSWPGGRCRVHLPAQAAARDGAASGSGPVALDCKGP